MINPTFKDFVKLTKQGNVIPVYKEISADLDTPVSAFMKLKKSSYSFLLESVEGQENIARYSFLGSGSSFVFKSKGNKVSFIYPDKNKLVTFTPQESPFAELKKIMRGFKSVHVKGLPRFCGGLVGYMGYDYVRFFEDIPDKNTDDLNLPDAIFMQTDTLLVFDHVKHTIKIVRNVILPKKNKFTLSSLKKIYNQAVTDIQKISLDFSSSFWGKNIEPLLNQKIVPVSNNSKKEFCDNVLKAKEYIRKGDVIQVVLSQRFSLPLGKKTPLDVYRRLRILNPSPYMFYLNLKDVTLVGSSPEILVRCEDGLVQTRPIAGTRPRGKTEEEDNLLEKQLRVDAKEKAEHLMLVDLGRNDLGRVCRNSSVKVSDFMSVERYSHVMHLVSNVTGKLNKGLGSFEALSACFPAGTVSGSPKIRAMEIIDELENQRRGPYAGCVGYFDFSGNMDTCITIRTIVIKDKTAYVQAGGGIVADSLPESEYRESQNKAKALLEAIAG